MAHAVASCGNALSQTFCRHAFSRVWRRLLAFPSNYDACASSVWQSHNFGFSFAIPDWKSLSCVKPCQRKTYPCFGKIPWDTKIKIVFCLFWQLYDTDTEVAMEAADVLDEACEDEVSWTQVHKNATWSCQSAAMTGKCSHDTLRR